MPLETANGIQDLNPSWPTGTDPKSQGDDHMRLTKGAIQSTFPNATGPWTTTNKVTAGGFDATDSRIENVGTPVDPTDAARKGETDALQQLVDTNTSDIVILDAAVANNAADIADHETRIVAIENQQFINSYGTVGSAGGIGSGGSGDWSVVRTSTGTYRITFDQPATSIDNNVLVGTCLDPNVQDATLDVANLAANQVEVRTYRNSSSTDVGFNFIRLRT